MRRVVDEQDRDVAPGQFGEVIARGPNIMQGYWKRPSETEEALRGGWLRTGDVARVDQDGNIFIIDRKKDIIISGGENISPAEVEDVLFPHPAVAECAVIGVPDAKWGETVKGVVVLAADQQTGEKDMMGKIQRRLLRDRFSGQG